jgi:hypothetical protein
MLEMGELLSLRNTPNNIENASLQEVLVVGCGHARCFEVGVDGYQADRPVSVIPS